MLTNVPLGMEAVNTIVVILMGVITAVVSMDMILLVVPTVLVSVMYV